DALPAGGAHHDVAEPRGRLAGLADLHHEVEAALLLEDLGDGPALGGRLDRVLDVLDIDAVAGGRGAVDDELELGLARAVVIVEVGDATNVPERVGYLPGHAVHHEGVRSIDLDGKLTLHAREL